MQFQFTVTVEVDREGWDLLKAKGYSDFQIKQNTLTNLRQMITAAMKHWYRTVYSIKIEEKNNESVILCNETT
jgi:broad-specificity NMP kinase